ncbi:MAG TPA: HEXXH motif-containing putative peptide modification protein [Pyrinomonadaceae bacterium]|nr:HEXXH motif-containing putative peptide modification protein [Pyrinomonadaceae bacterium]
MASSLHHCYSNPHDFGANRVFSSSAVVYYRECCRLFVRYFSSQLESRSHGIRSLIERWLASEAVFDDVWSLPFGSVEALLDGSKSSRRLLVTAAQLALRLSERGTPGDWEISLEDQATFLWGPYVVSGAGRLRVSSDGKFAAVEIGAEDCRRIITFNSSGSTWSAESLDTLHYLHLKSGLALILSPEALNNAKELTERLSDPSPDEALARCEAALDLIGRSSGEYLHWFSRVVRGILPVAGSSTRSFSSSSRTMPGIIAASTSVDIPTLAEILVHEASHQYFYLLEQQGPVDDGTDARLYFSPIRGTDRPLRAILLAYHAFGNVLLFYRACRKSGAADAQLCESRERILLQQVNGLKQALVTTSALTKFGNALWLPLAAHIAKV